MSLIGCRFLHLDYNSEQEMLLINHAMLIIRIGGIYNGKGEIYDSNLDKLRI